MSDISKHTLFVISCFSFLTISQTTVGTHIIRRNGSNNTKQFQEIENDFINQTLNDKLTSLDYYFFSYEIIDHITLLIKFDITRTILFQHSQVLYDAHLFISKLPSFDYKINIGPFFGFYQKELEGTITDHFTFCLVLIPSRYQNMSNILLNRNKTETIYNDFIMSSSQEQQQHTIHYCTKMGPDEDRHRYHTKQGSRGDHILLLLQLVLIGIILVFLQIAHTIRDRKPTEWHLRRLNRMQRELLRRKEYNNMPNETLAMLRFTSIKDEESQEEIDDPESDEEEDEDEKEELILSHRRLPTRGIIYQRSRSSSPSIGPINTNANISSVEHILQTKPWLQIPH